MASSAYVGLALTAHNNDALSSASFDLVALMRNTPVQLNNFRVLQVLRSDSDALIITFSQTGKTYQLQRSTGLGPALWQNVGSPHSGTGNSSPSLTQLEQPDSGSSIE